MYLRPDKLVLDEVRGGGGGQAKINLKAQSHSLHIGGCLYYKNLALVFALRRLPFHWPEHLF